MLNPSKKEVIMTFLSIVKTNSVIATLCQKKFTMKSYEYVSYVATSDFIPVAGTVSQMVKCLRCLSVVRLLPAPKMPESVSKLPRWR